MAEGRQRLYADEARSMFEFVLEESVNMTMARKRFEPSQKNGRLRHVINDM